MGVKKEIVLLLISITIIGLCIWKFSGNDMCTNTYTDVNNLSEQSIAASADITAENIELVTPKPTIDNYDYSKFDWKHAKVPDDIKKSF